MLPNNNIQSTQNIYILYEYIWLRIVSNHHIKKEKKTCLSTKYNLLIYFIFFGFVLIKMVKIEEKCFNFNKVARFGDLKRRKIKEYKCFWIQWKKNNKMVTITCKIKANAYNLRLYSEIYMNVLNSYWTQRKKYSNKYSSALSILDH